VSIGGSRVGVLIEVGLLMLRRGSSPQHQSSSPVHAPIPPVLDGVVASPVKFSSNVCPTLPHLGDHAFDLKPLFRADGLVVEGWL
jgi:hypothetical protein